MSTELLPTDVSSVNSKSFALTEARTCFGCRHWKPSTTECRALPPFMDGWPKTMKDDYCGTFSPSVRRGFGTPPKVSDETLIKLVRSTCIDEKSSDGKGGTVMLPKRAFRRADLIQQLMEMGMTRTPALKRILTMVRRGIFKMGENPWPLDGDEPGIYVWMDIDDKADFKDGDMLEAIRSVSPTEVSARGLRDLHRRLQSKLGFSLATFSRRINEYIAEGLVIRTDRGFYAPSPAPLVVDLD